MNQDNYAEERASTFVSKRGWKLEEKRMVPEDDKPKALIFLCHGYAHNIGGYMEHFEDISEKGFGVFGISHHGHGRSQGMKALVMDYNFLIDDFSDYVESVLETYPGVPAFVIGQSMGGAIALMATSKEGRLEKLTRGTILLAPMCKIAKEMMLPQWVISSFSWAASWFPSAPITPIKSILHNCFKDPVKVQEALSDPLGYTKKPRLMTSLQMLALTEKVEESIPSYSTPLVVLHGTADMVTSPEASKYLVDNAASEDKDLVMLDDMWHALLSEPDPNPAKVKDIMVKWMEERLE
eukprot:m.27471 g.27471  ORF g.27471 m.27471 type:complete len:295 (+) comp5944_c0_seq1:815-1699(+)